MTYAVQQLVDPTDLLVVEIAGAAAPVVALWCRFVPARDARGGMAVAVEIGVDSANPRPQVAYYCPEQRIRRLVMPAADVRRVSPYATD